MTASAKVAIRSFRQADRPQRYQIEERLSMGRALD
jgi:hypothetical protein